MPEAMSSIQKLRICVMPIRHIDRKFKIVFYHIFKTLKLYDFWFLQQATKES